MATSQAQMPLLSSAAKAIAPVERSRPHAKRLAITPGERYRSRVWEDMGRLFQQSRLSDVMLAAEGRFIPCHKVLLAAASSFFCDQFSTNPETLEHNKVYNVQQIDFDTLTSIVGFIYSGQIELTVEETEKLIPASINLELPELIEECRIFLLEKMRHDASLSVDVYMISKANSLENTAQRAWKVMLQNVKEVIATSSFKELPLTELLEYIKEEDLNVVNEDPVFEAVVTWVRHDLENRKIRFETLLEHVILLHCSLIFLKDVVMQEPLMKEGNGFQRISEVLISHATLQTLQLGTPRKAQHINSLISMYLYIEPFEQCFLLSGGESEWLSRGLVGGKFLKNCSACNTSDGILVTGGVVSKQSSAFCWNISLPTLNCTRVADLNVARRNHASVCVRGTQFYVLGGAFGRFLNSVEYLTELNGSWRSTTDMPIALYLPTAVSYKDYIYVFGGYTHGYTTSRACFVLDCVSKVWDRKADMPDGCVWGSSVLYNDRIYVLGGLDNCCMSYSPDEDRWECHVTASEDHTGGSAVVWGDRILLCGGYYTTVIEEYNPHTDTWTDWNHSLPDERCRAVLGAQL